mgnify:CR=1 FL=1
MIVVTASLQRMLFEEILDFLHQIIGIFFSIKGFSERDFEQFLNFLRFFGLCLFELGQLSFIILIFKIIKGEFLVVVSILKIILRIWELIFVFELILEPLFVNNPHKQVQSNLKNHEDAQSHEKDFLVQCE